MKQVVLRGGSPTLIDVPQPLPRVGHALVANAASVISSGTERAAVDSSGGGASLPARMMRNPELIRLGLEHLREHGMRKTIDVARGLSAADLPLGYSSCGLVVDSGGLAEFPVGQLVACGGAGYANHAEMVSVPGNLVSVVPSEVEASEAAFATIGAIALQGVRRASPSIGERIVVVGLGLLGLITVQLLAASGCQVFGVEPDPRRRELALSVGAAAVAAPADSAPTVAEWSAGVGADAVVVCAAGGGSHVADSSARLLRAKGRVIIVGDVSLEFDRSSLYGRETDVLMSTSYGPGRYDSVYEEFGVDYPIAYVRWTENRNMGEVLRLMSTGQLRMAPLIDLTLPVDRSQEAYGALGEPEPPLAAVLTYPDAARQSAQPSPRVTKPQRSRQSGTGPVRVAIIGVGDFARGVHIPNIRENPRAEVSVVVASRGTKAADAARMLGGADVATDWRSALARDDVDLVVITTRHDSHAEIATEALAAGKAVFVEKPLGLSRAEIDQVWEAARENPRLAIGFNRRFAPLAAQLKRELQDVAGAPIHLIYRVSAPLDASHWLNDPAVGGGRILGEGSHMFDFANWLCGTPDRVLAAGLPSRNGNHSVESSSITVQYRDGSVATVHYSGVGASALPKERIELLAGGRAWVLDDFKVLASFNGASATSEILRATQKGHKEIMESVVLASMGLVQFEPSVTDAYLAQSVGLGALESIATGSAQPVRMPGR